MGGDALQSGVAGDSNPASGAGWVEVGEVAKAGSDTMATTHVYIVHHVRKLSEEREDVKLIGVYSTELQAQRALSRLKSAAGFRDYPDGFTVSRYELNVDHWTDGFIPV